MKKTLFLILLLSFFCSSPSQAQNDSVVNKLVNYVRNVNDFTKYIPQEKVYLHFDNNSYYKGDDIWFKCYIVTSELNKAANLSKTLYVELLNPGGEIIDKKTLRIENGQCHGNLSLRNPVFYSGFYEVRAFTKYMLNFDEDAIFSRTFPVFDSPKNEGEYKQEIEWTRNKYPEKRKAIKKGKKVNVSFYPEGGNLIFGVNSRIAFQATDEKGLPIPVEGVVINSEKEEIVRFSTSHQGRGVFSYTPTGEKIKVKIKYKNKEHDVKMPEPLVSGYAMSINNPFQSDSISVGIKRNSETPADTLGIAVLSRGKVNGFHLVKLINDRELALNFSKEDLPGGISQVILFNKEGRILSDRLFFVSHDDQLIISQNQDKERYMPYDLVNMDFLVKDQIGNLVSTTFSLSVRDASDGITYKDNIWTNLLLSSEIKGYIDNPSYYFEKNDEEHWSHLDLLMQVQGWRRYIWNQMAGLEPFDLKWLPEQSITMKGHVRSLVKRVPKANVDVSLYMTEKDKEKEDRNVVVQNAKTDSLGNFRVDCDLDGRWDMVFVTQEKNKKKDYDVLFDRLFSPSARGYAPYETIVRKSEVKGDGTVVDEELSDYSHLFDSVPDDSISLGINQKVHRLKEVTVTVKRSRKEREREEHLSQANAFYNVMDGLDDIADNGGFVGDDIYAFLKNVNDNIMVVRGTECTYKHKKLLYVVDNNGRSYAEGDSSFISDSAPIAYLRLADVESIYLSDSPTLIMKFKPWSLTMEKALGVYGAVLFIETYKDERSRPKRRGVRRTTLNGYSLQKEFYSPDYSILPKEADYRRTLYWNPNVKTDEQGKAKVQFYNNSTCRSMVISAETVTSEGIPGVYKPE